MEVRKIRRNGYQTKKSKITRGGIFLEFIVLPDIWWNILLLKYGMI